MCFAIGRGAALFPLSWRLPLLAEEFVSQCIERPRAAFPPRFLQRRHRAENRAEIHLRRVEEGAHFAERPNLFLAGRRRERFSCRAVVTLPAGRGEPSRRRPSKSATASSESVSCRGSQP